MTRTEFAGLVAKRVNTDWSWLIPIIEALVEALIEQCFETEAAFLAAVADPSAGLEWRLELRCRRALRQHRRDICDRRAIANAMTTALIDTAWECTEEELKALYQAA